MPTKQKVTVEDYLALPDWEKPYLEYIDGEVVPKPMPDRRHQNLSEEFIYSFGPYMRQRGWRGGPEGRIEFVAPDRTDFRLPDISYWAPDKPRSGGRAMQPATLAFEVRSPDQSMPSQRERCRFFRANGVDVVWLADPDSRTIEVFDGETDGAVFSGADILTSAHLPDFELRLADLFAALDR